MEKEHKESQLVRGRKDYVVSPAWFPRTGSSITQTRLPEKESSAIVRSMKGHIAMPAWCPRDTVLTNVHQSNSEVTYPDVKSVKLLIGGEKIVFPMVG